MTTPDETGDLIAVVGIGLAVPGASSPAQLWRTLNGGRDAFSEPGDRFDLDHFWSGDPHEEDRTYARRAGYLHDFLPHPDLSKEEDAGPGRDDAARWLRHALLQAREHVRTGPDRRCAAYVGAWPGGSQSLVESVLVDAVLRPVRDGRQAERIGAALFAHYRHALPLDGAATPDAVVREVFSRLPDPVTEACVVDTACASSLYAVDLGAKALLAGECEIAYCGGVTVVDPTMAVMFAKLNGLSPRGRVRAFTEAADGTLFSDGAGVVALKTLRQATRDGDPVHGVLLGFGAAADGRGKSISAPNPDGQRRAIERARSVSSVSSDQVDWVVAHGTGTAAGDRVESQVLSALGPASGQLCTSNKPVFGHTGWTAGAVSLIHALLGLRYGWVPAQLGAAEAADRPAHGLRVPAGPVRFAPRPGGRRTVGISAFGFGGTNAHLLVADRAEGTGLRSGPPPRPAGGDLVLVAWAAQLPGAPSTGLVRDWLRGSADAPAASFPHPYPAPPPSEARLSARTLPVVDPAQLMGLQAAARLVAEYGELWADLRETTGVIAAHTGMPRGLAGTAVRCYAHDATTLLERHAAEPGFADAARQLEETRRDFPACTEDSQAGVLPNVIASRIAARYDLHGPALAVDAGVDSTLTALRVAQRYLRTGELDLALVLAVNGNATAANAALARTGATPLAEGAFLLAVTTGRLAERRGWRALGRLSFTEGTAEAGGAPAQAAPDRSYLAADHAVALLRAVESAGPPVRLPGRHTGTALTVSPAGTPRARPLPPSSSHLTTRYAHSLVLQPPPEPRPFTPPPLPPRGLLLAQSAEAAAPVRAEAEASGTTVLVLPDRDDGRPSARDREELLAAVDRAAPHLTVVGDLSALSLHRALALHETTFLAVRRLWARRRPDDSLVVLLGKAPAGPAAPAAALFEGLVKSLRWERPDAVAVTVTTDEAPDGALLARAAVERAAPGLPPVVRLLRGERWTEALHPAPLPAAVPEFDLLPDDCVGVVTGGTSGLARELLAALPRRLRPRLWLLGRTPAGDPAPRGSDGTAGGPLPEDRAALIRRIRGETPGLPTREVVARADDVLRRRKAHHALRTLRARFGDDRVHYAVCDMTAEDPVRDVVDRILHDEGRVDFVLHAAGQVASTLLRNKTPETFRAVRDTKVLGHHHLATALASRPPRLWCNIGSYSGTAGAPGDTDYASANAYLAAAADAATGPAQITIGFTMWRQTGMGADDLFQEHVARQGRFTPIPTEEGAAQFLAELRAATLAGGAAVYLGPAERDRLRQHRPGLVRDERPPYAAGRQRPAWWRRRPADADDVEWTHLVDPDLERHLFDHLVGGKPTVPATFLLDLAAHAAEALVPGAVTTGFRDARFDAFLRPFNRRTPAPLRIRARRLPDRPDGAGPPRSAVAVSVHSDTLDPRGGLRPGALRHFRAVVLLDRDPRAQAPRRPSHRPHAPVAAWDAYAAPDAPVSLRGPFRNLSDCRVDGTTAYGLWTPSLTGRPWLRTMTTPALFLCAALRTLALRPDDADHQPLFVPRSIGRIELYTEGANDHDLLLRHGHGLTVSADADGTCRGVAPDGRVLTESARIDLVDVTAPPPAARARPDAVAHRAQPPGRPASSRRHGVDRTAS